MIASLRFIAWLVIAIPFLYAHNKSKALPNDVKALAQKHHSKPLHQGQKKSNKNTETIDASCTNCPKIIAYFEKKYGIPQHLMMAIARVESRCRPWAIHHNGASLQFRQPQKALAFLKTATGNIQIGCMQLDISSHSRRFKTTEMMMAPYHNIEFAAKLLKRLYKRHGSWERAVSFYHAASPKAQKAYCKRIAKQLAQLKDTKQISGENSWI